MPCKGIRNQRAGKSDDKKSGKIPDDRRHFFELYQFTKVDYMFIEVFSLQGFSGDRQKKDLFVFTTQRQI